MRNDYGLKSEYPVPHLEVFFVENERISFKDNEDLLEKVYLITKTQEKF
jgi:hypothetical protein